MTTFTKAQAAKMVRRPYSTICMWCRDMGFGPKLELGEVNELIARSEKPDGRKRASKECKETWIRSDTVAIIIQDEGGELALMTRADFMQRWLDGDIQEEYPSGIFHEVSAIHRAKSIVSLHAMVAEDAVEYYQGA